MIPTAIVIAAALVAIGVGWYVFEGRWDRRLFSREASRVVENLRPRAAQALMEMSPAMQILDVRSPREFAGGSLPGAANISLGDPTFAELAGRLDRTRPVLVYCAGGYRGRKAVAILRDLGFTSIHHLHRGFYSWRLAGLPVAPPHRPPSSPD